VNVVAERDGVRSSEVFQGNVAEPILSCSIPELHLTRLALRKGRGGDLVVNTDSADRSAIGRRSVNGPKSLQELLFEVAIGAGGVADEEHLDKFIVGGVCQRSHNLQGGVRGVRFPGYSKLS
jgi:hypothetical protein